MSVAESRPELAGAFVRSGKVRDLYRLDDGRLLLVASDRISAFDVVLPTAIPDKGKLLTGLSRYWFAETAGLLPNHLLGTDPSTLPEPFAAAAESLRGRVMICRTVDVLPIEVIVRGYLSGSGWKEYLRDGAVSGVPLPPGLRESERLAAPIFTPSTKAEVGHDENITFAQAAERVGEDTAKSVRELALQIYGVAAARAESVGLILADTKFEFGIDPGNGELLLIDELLTPDSSRFWDADSYEPGRAQASFDKQFVRDWLETQAWDKTPPGPALPAEVVEGTRRRYAEAFERITGASLERYLREDRLA
jgi:phosphoribosylaminoimidazole-succinocarboxamide synthase